MRVLIGGASGMVGKALTELLIKNGHPVVKLVRCPVKNELSEIFWDPEKGIINKNELDEFDVVVHLGGYNVAKNSWSKKIKQKIKESRVKSTALLAKTLSSLENKPKLFINASGINIYGYNENINESVDENSPARGKDFLSEVIQEWEGATQPLKDAGIRVVHARFSAVLSPSGGLLGKVLPIFKMAAGGKLGSGKQILSWIDLEDAVGVLYHCMNNEKLYGAVNIVAPKPVTNKEFTKTLATAVGLPALIPMPEILIKSIFAEMGETLMLASINCKSNKLNDYNFKFPTLSDCLNHQLEINVSTNNKK